MITLLIDDVAEIRELVQMNLQQHYPHMTFLHASSGSEACEFLDNLGPRVSIIVCDFNMPEGNGDLVFQKWQESHFHVPFIMLTSEVEQASKTLLAGHKNLWERLDFIEKDSGFEKVTNSFEELINKSFIHIPLNWFQPDISINYPVFISLNDMKIVQYTHAHETLSSKKIKEFETKGLEGLLIPAKKIIEKNLKWPHFEIHTYSNELKPSLKDAFGSFRNLHEKVLLSQYFCEKEYQKANRLLGQEIENVSKKDLLTCLREKDLTIKEYVTHHSFLIGILCFMFLDELDLNNSTNRQYCFEAIILHDLFKTNESAFNDDLIIETLDLKKMRESLIQVQSVAKDLGLSLDTEKILEALYMHRAPRDMTSGAHKLARVARMSHLIVSEMYRESFVSKVSQERIKSFDDDKRILEASQKIFL